MAQDSDPDFYLRWRHCETPGMKTLCNLGKLLNKLQREHRAHVELYTSGHLNPDKLYKPQREDVFHWASSQWPKLERDGGGQPASKKVAEMTDALVHFTLNTALKPDDVQGTRIFRYLNLVPQDAPHPSEEDLLLECPPEAVSPERPKKEELRWPDMKVLKSKYRKSSWKCGQCPGKDEYQYVSAYLAGITKEDQYQQFLRFQKGILAKKDLLSSDFTGAKAVLALEKKLDQKLQKVCTCEADDFNRMYVCGEIFEDVCNNSLIFGDLLKEIKEEYELYMAILLHSQPLAQYQALRSHVRAMKWRSLKTEEVSQAREELKALVKALKAALEHNDKLREELETERRLAQAEKEGSDSFKTNQVDEECLTHVQKVEAKRCEILRKWDEIKAIEKEMKTSMVHIGALNVSENKLKSIEAETQKLEIEIKILKKNINVIENQLKQSVGKATMSEKQQKRLWTIINNFLGPDKTDDDSEVIKEMASEMSLVLPE